MLQRITLETVGGVLLHSAVASAIVLTGVWRKQMLLNLGTIRNVVNSNKTETGNDICAEKATISR